MKAKLNTSLVSGARIFTGIYESIWDVIEYDDDGNELYVEYNSEDLMRSILDRYQSSEDYILSELNDYSEFKTKSIKFTDFYIPRYFNYGDAGLDFEIEFSKKDLITTANKLLRDAKFKQFLADNYTSRDGFISQTPNNLVDWYDEITTTHNFERALSAMLNYLWMNDNEDFYNSIEGTMHEDWSGNGYNGLDYKIIKD